MKLYGHTVIPRVRELLADPGAEPALSVLPVAAGRGVVPCRDVRRSTTAWASLALARSAQPSREPPLPTGTTSPSVGSGAAERIELIVDLLAPGAPSVTTDEVVSTPT